MTSPNTLQSSPPPLKKRKISHDASDHGSAAVGSAFTIRVCRFYTKTSKTRALSLAGILYYLSIADR
jgi:hypothetical protein